MRAEKKARHDGIADWYKAKINADKRARQRIFCDVYAQTASVAMASEAAEVTSRALLTWKRTDPDFCEMYNEAIEQLQETLRSSVFVRAIGERPYDENGNPAVDADGKPIYRNASDRLSMALLGLDKDSSKDKEGGTVTIEIVSPSERRGVVVDAEFEKIEGPLN